MQPDITLPKTAKVKIYEVLLDQTGSNAPIATILQNTTGLIITWSRTAIGTYFGTLNEEIDPTKCTIIVGAFSGNITNGAYFDSNTAIKLNTRIATNNSDDILYQTTFQLKIYQ